MAIITAGDFVGKFETHTKETSNTRLSSYIERYERYYLLKMLGVELYDLFMAGIEEDPVPAIYDKIFEPLAYQESRCGSKRIFISNGVKDMLLGFVYFEYTRDNETQATGNYPVKVKGQNSDTANVMIAKLYDRWNESVTTYKAIQAYILSAPDDYPTFAGERINHKFLHW